MKKSALKKAVKQNIADKRARRKAKRNRSFRRKRVRSKFVDSAKRDEQKNKNQFQRPRKRTVTKSPHPDFRLLENTEEVISFLQELKSAKSAARSVGTIILDLRKVEKIDIGAICILLSVVEELSFSKITIRGNFPDDPECMKVFVESGFLQHMDKITGTKYESPKKANLIIKQGRDTTKNREIGLAVKEAVGLLTGVEAHYNPVYSIIQEINGNAVEHAYSNDKHWLFGFNYDEQNNKVIFTFADNGYGILKTLKKKFSQSLFDKLNLRTDGEILKRAFEKKYGSRHIEHGNRNKGLPWLNKTQNQKEVKNLIVITNKVSLHIDKGTVQSLDSYFSGTFYYWELDVECIEKWKSK